MEFWIREDQFVSLHERFEILGVPVAESIRRAIDLYLAADGRRFGSKKKGATHDAKEAKKR